MSHGYDGLETVSKAASPARGSADAADRAHHAKADAPVLPADQRHRKVPGRHAVQQGCLLGRVAICAGSKLRFSLRTTEILGGDASSCMFTPCKGGRLSSSSELCVRYMT